MEIKWQHESEVFFLIFFSFLNQDIPLYFRGRIRQKNTDNDISGSFQSAHTRYPTQNMAIHYANNFFHCGKKINHQCCIRGF